VREAGVDRDLVETMNATLVHRGPDSAGIFVDDLAALGARRLAIIDLETGDQPLANEDESVHVVQNGEIYNYRELRGDLERSEEHTSELQSLTNLVCRLLLEKKKQKNFFERSTKMD